MLYKCSEHIRRKLDSHSLFPSHSVLSITHPPIIQTHTHTHTDTHTHAHTHTHTHFYHINCYHL
ncbi:hypothetical protein O3M35_008531 [Rhynocoris fuscipes]|uniref:Uncharacterized protein n=1 Tax=Rhynocoris fuscipes TaxID=488301 RepID=A0AAW1D7C9_9HEMI